MRKDPESHRDGSAGVDEYYGIVAAWLDRSLHGRGDTAWWRDRVRAFGPGPVLELGCGTGRVTACLAECARPVIGLDRSEAMLAMARERLASRPDIRLIRGDLRDLPLRDASIQCAVAAADPLIHLTTDADRRRAIDEAARVLAPDGRLLLEFLWWTPTDRERALSATGLERNQLVGGTGSDAIGIHERWWESTGGSVRGTYRFRARGKNTAEASFIGRRWTREELDRRLRRAGLEIVHEWGGFDGRPFEPDTARVLLVEAKFGTADT